MKVKNDVIEELLNICTSVLTEVLFGVLVYTQIFNFLPGAAILLDVFTRDWKVIGSFVFTCKLRGRG